MDLLKKSYQSFLKIDDLQIFSVGDEAIEFSNRTSKYDLIRFENVEVVSTQLDDIHNWGNASAIIKVSTKFIKEKLITPSFEKLDKLNCFKNDDLYYQFQNKKQTTLRGFLFSLFLFSWSKSKLNFLNFKKFNIR